VRAGQSPDDGAPIPGGTLRLLRPGRGEDTLDFSPASQRQDFQVVASYLDPLLRPDPATLAPQPWLAERWAWSDGDTVVTYTLRGDVRWHDGTPLTAADVAFSFEVYRDDIASGVPNLFALMAEATALDDRTLRVTLTDPDGGWLPNASTQPVFQRAQYAAHWTAAPVGQRTLDGFDWVRSAPIGTGPWVVGKRSAGGVEFARHDGYWAGPPHAERLTVGWEASNARRITAWREGEVDLLWPLETGDLDLVNEQPGRLYAADAASVMFAAFNFDNPARATPDLFGDVRVRRALSLAIDRPRIGEEVFRGFVRPEAVGTIAQPWLHDADRRAPARDVEAARDLLAAAGWEDRDGDGVADSAAGSRLSLTVIFRTDIRPELRPALERVADDLAEAGVELTVDSLGPDSFRERWTTGRDYDLIAFAYDLYPGFTDFDLYGSGWDIRVNPQGWNPGGYRNDEVDAAVAEALTAVDPAALRAALGRLQRAADDDLFALWLGFPHALILAGSAVRGFRPNAAWQTWDTREVWLTP